MDSVRCTVYTVQCNTMYIVQYTMYDVCNMYDVMYCIQCSLYSTYCILHCICHIRQHESYITMHEGITGYINTYTHIYIQAARIIHCIKPLIKNSINRNS